MANKTVQVLMATYNGENYVHEQITSIVEQTFPNISLLIRDDLSTDNTCDVIVDKHREVKLIRGDINLGVVQSFLELLKISDEADYYSLADQDDVWLEYKIERAIQFLSQHDNDQPLLYCAAVEVVDENLKFKGYLASRKKGPSFKNALVQNIATGCTIVMNKAARDLIISVVPNSQRIVMHDWWFYLIISAFGKVIYDPHIVMYYRQHSNNAFGSGYSSIQRWIPRVKRFVRKKEAGINIEQVKEFYQLFGSTLDDQKKEIILELLQSRQNFYKRIKFSLSNKVFRQNTLENIICHLLLIFNKW